MTMLRSDSPSVCDAQTLLRRLTRTPPALAFSIAIGLLASPVRTSGAAPLVGATAVLQQIAQESKNTNDAPAQTTETSKWLKELKDFTSRLGNTPPDEAASTWLSFADRLREIDASEIQTEASPSDTAVLRLMDALPHPSAWPALARAVNARPKPATENLYQEQAFRLLGAALNGDSTALAQHLKELETSLVQADARTARAYLNAYRAIDDAAMNQSDNPDVIIAGIERQLAAAEREQQSWGRTVVVPDLVALTREEVASPLLKRVLTSKVKRVTIHGAATTDLARKLLVRHIDEITVPRWDLVSDSGAVEVFEALEKKFPPVSASPTPPGAAPSIESRVAELSPSPSEDTYSRQAASAHYLMGLIAKNRIDDATAFAEKFGSNASTFGIQSAAVNALERAGYVNTLDDFLHRLLSRNPRLPFWYTYVNVAARAGTTERMLEVTREAARTDGGSDAKGSELRQHLINALLAADKIDEAVQEIRKELGTGDAEGSRTSRANRRPSAGGFNDHFQSPSEDPALRLAQIGVLLERPEWVEEGLRKALDRKSPPAQDRWQSDMLFGPLLALLGDAGKPDVAEQQLANRLIRQIRAGRSELGGSSMFYGDSSPAGFLSLLVGLYHRNQRSADVLSLFENSPDWHAADLIGLLSGYAQLETDPERPTGAHFSAGSRVTRFPLATAAAEALHRSQRIQEARRIAEFQLDQTPEDDRAYERFIEIAAPEALARFDDVFARDPFQERPLIWKSLLLLRAGKLDDAEKVARQAIAIDPSDGEQGKGDRMRVYSILADIREARGDAKEAEVLRGAVRAIRLSERADDFFAAGLLTRAVAMYQDSLKHFTDAYCIQSRLAVQLANLGQTERAAVHYQKAFELMPDSFGRIESHCFGCESTFASQPAQSVAERVFTRLVQQNPNKPQIHYLFGYLRHQQGKGKEALPHFRRAVELDPDYLNAWVKLKEISRAYRLPSRDSDEASFQILRLDPLQRHSNAGLQDVTDLARLWTAVSNAHRPTIPRPDSLLPLPASRDALRQLGGEERARRLAMEMADQEDGKNLTPQRAIAQQKLVAAILALLSRA